MIPRGLYKDQPIIAITFDTDNCPELAIEFLQKRLDNHGIPATFFCTQRYETLHPPHEAALHPFLKEFVQLDQTLAPLHALMAAIPEAVGNRCHQLTANGMLYRHLGEKGFLYDSSWPLYLHKNLSPFHLHSGLYELPIFWVEQIFYEEGLSRTFLERLHTPGLKIFLFHPVHVYHNSTGSTYRDLMKIPYPDRYRPELVNQGEGILTFFDFLLETVSRENLLCATCKDIVTAENTPDVQR